MRSTHPPLATTLAAFIVLAASLAVGGAARAYVRAKSQDGKHVVIWPDPRVTMTVLTGDEAVLPPDDLVGAATRAGATWSDPALSSSIAFTVERLDLAAFEPTFDHLNTIAFRADWPPPYHDGTQLALTTVWTQGGRIVDADTEINGATPAYPWAILSNDPTEAARSNDVDLQNALTHELGHVIGLDHPCYLGDPPDPPETTNTGADVPACSPTLPASVLEATMYPSATPGSISERALSADERLALHDLYPAGRAPIVDGAASGGCAVAGGRGSRGAGALATAVALIALAHRRRRGLHERRASR